jgi:hypothetical protein
MGFKCPVCWQDFGQDIAKYKAHIKENHQGVGKDIVDCLNKITHKENKEKRT